MSVLIILACVLHADDPARPPEKPNIPWGGTDFKQYWTTSKLIVDGHNPYDYALAREVQKPMRAGATQVPYGPPTSLLPFIPLGWLDFPTAVQTYFLVNVVMMVMSSFLWGKMLFPRSEWMPLAAIVSIVAWLPCLTLFGIGHVTSFTLFGFTVWMFLMQQNRPALAGAVLALSIIKPHLAAGPVFYACLVAWKQKRWSMLLGFGLTVAAMILATVVIRPTIWGEYLASLPESNPTQWLNATLDGWGRRLLKEFVSESAANAFRLVSLGVALLLTAWIAILGWRHPLRPVNAMLVLALWICATPYAFSYDFVLLLPCFILALGEAIRCTKPRWWLVLLGWVTLDVFYYYAKSLGKEHGWWEDDFFLIPWGGLLLTLFLLPHDPDVNRQDAKG